MAIYHYDGTQKTPKNYVGYRVAVSVNGELRQKWYKETKEKPKEAEELDRLWRFEQQLYKDSKNRERKERANNSAYVTGIAGIKMKFIPNGRRVVKGELKRYYTPAFVVSGSSNGKQFFRPFNIKTLGYDMAWFKACRFASEKYGENLLDKMLKKKPPVEQFHIIYRWQAQQLGLNIPLSSLPDELIEKGSTLEDLIN